MQVNDYISELDTKRFGFNIAKFDPEVTDIPELLNILKTNDVRLTMVKVSLDKLELMNQLERQGFVVKDIQVTYKFDLNLPIPIIIPDKNDIINIRDANIEDIPVIECLAKKSFANYGHYASDKKLPIDKVGEIYGDWARRSILESNVTDKIILAEVNNKIAGFLSFKIYSHGNLRFAAGGLGAVSEEYRNKNVFRIITLKGLEWGKEIDLAWEEHNVIITNYPVNSSFTKLGFKVYKSFATMHLWL